MGSSSARRKPATVLWKQYGKASKSVNPQVSRPAALVLPLRGSSGHGRTSAFVSKDGGFFIWRTESWHQIHWSTTTVFPKRSNVAFIEPFFHDAIYGIFSIIPFRQMFWHGSSEQPITDHQWGSCSLGTSSWSGILKFVER